MKGMIAAFAAIAMLGSLACRRWRPRQHRWPGTGRGNGPPSPGEPSGRSNRTFQTQGGAMRAIQIAGIAAAGVVVLGVAGLAGAALIGNHSPAPLVIRAAAPARTTPALVKTKIKYRTRIVVVTPAPAVPAPPSPARPAAPPQGTWGRQPDPGPAYAADIANAGITAPYGWLMSTGNTLCDDWAAGEATSQSDPLLTAGGIYAYHLAAFDAITNADMCPGITP